MFVYKKQSRFLLKNTFVHLLQTKIKNAQIHPQKRA